MAVVPSPLVLNGEGVCRDVIAIGASAGGIEALMGLLSMLPSDVPAVIAVVLHRSPYAASYLAEVLERSTGRRMVEPVDGQSLEKGSVFLAPRDHHMTVDDGRFHVARGPKEHFTRPAVDPLFSSVALAYGPRVSGVLLSGSGDDGVAGLIRIKAAGGMSLVQAPDQAKHPSMPVNAIRYDGVDAALPVNHLALALGVLAAGQKFELPRASIA
jgi:two-component system chemotaxis response regulator CheB